MATPPLAGYPIEEMTAELSRLAMKKDLTPDDFFKRFLAVSLPAVEANRGIVWGLSPNGELNRICEICEEGDYEPRETKNPQSTFHLEHLYGVIRSGQLQFLRAGDNRFDWISRSANSLLLAPLHLNENCVGVVECEFENVISAVGESEIGKLMQPLLKQASRYVARQHAQLLRGRLPFPHEKLDQFVLSLHADDRSRHVAMTAANEGRTLLNCDRICIASALGKRVKVLAISGQENVLSESNLVQAMCRLAQQVLSCGRAIHFDGSLEGFAPQVEQSIVNYLQESGAHAFLAIPLFASRIRVELDEESPLEETKPYGVVIVEQIADGSSLCDLKLIERFTKHVSQALFHTLEHEKVFLLPVRRWLGRLSNRTEKSTWHKLTWFAIVSMLILAAFIFIPFPYQVQSTGKIMPVEQSRYYAPVDGEVVEVFVASGQVVEAGRPLLRLHSDELSTRLLLIQNQLSEKRQVLTALEVERDQTGSSSRDEQIRLQGRISKTLIEVQGLESRLEAISREAALLTVNSQMTGKVTTFEPEKLLIGRPVRRGQLLLEVMNEGGLWQLELEIPAHKLGHIQSAQEISDSKTLPLKFILATMPERNFAGRIQQLSTRIMEKPDGTRVVQATATINSESLQGQTACAEVLARIDAGNKNLGYVLFGDLFDALRKWIW